MASTEWISPSSGNGGTRPKRQQTAGSEALGRLISGRHPSSHLCFASLVVIALIFFPVSLRAQTVRPAEQLNPTADFKEKSKDLTAEPPVIGYGPTQERYGPMPSTLVSSGDLQLADIIASVYRSYPEILAAKLEHTRTQGVLLGAYGAYDTKLKAYSLSEPTGFYRNFRHGIGVARQTWWGGTVAAGYRLGRGQFQPWYKERETNEGGEVALGVSWPLLQGRAIDPQRLSVFRASIDTRAVDPHVELTVLQTSRDASIAYWQWVAAGMKMAAQQDLLGLAELRGEQFRVGVEAGKFAEVDLILNNQLIAERRGSYLESLQKFQAVGFKLSLFLRDDAGHAMVPDESILPEVFPKIQPIDNGDFNQDLAFAMARRPEPSLLQFELRRLNIERQLACNQRLPRLDALVEASQDMGIPASLINDKGQFQLLVGLQGEVPVQRRKARGKVQETSAKIAQVNQKVRLLQDKIGIELQTAYNALQIAQQLVRQEELAVEASLDTLNRYQFAYERGKADLIYVNLLETKVNELEIKLVEAQQSWFSALAAMQFALGLDPLDQAISISQLPSKQDPDASNRKETLIPDQQEDSSTKEALN